MLSNKGDVSATLSLADPNPRIPSKGTPMKASPSYSVTAPNIWFSIVISPIFI